MPQCEFGERQFEFCANYQLQTSLGAYLVGGLPTIPTQAQESLKGYDAAYSFKSGRLLFLQYKVAHYSPKAWGSGAATYNLWGGPYFRSELHRDRYGYYSQHNALVALTSAAAESLYVAPCFYKRKDLAVAFAGGSGSGVVDRSLLAPLAEVPTFSDTDAHSISYGEDGKAFRLHSEPTDPFEGRTSILAAVERVEESEWGPRFFSELRDELLFVLGSQELRPPDSFNEGEFDGPLDEIAAALDQRVGAVLALFPTRTKRRRAA